MSETKTTDRRAPGLDDIAFPHGRYGRRREHRRRRPMVAAVLTLAVVAAGLGVSWRLYDQYGGAYTSNLLAYDDSVTGQVSVTFEVFKPAGEGAVCRVRSRDVNGAEIGSAKVQIPADGSTRVVETYILPVAGEPNTGEVQRCWQAD